MAIKAMHHITPTGDVSVGVPHSGTYPALLLEWLGEGTNFRLVNDLTTRDYDEDSSGVGKYTKVNFKKGVTLHSAVSLTQWLNANQ